MLPPFDDAGAIVRALAAAREHVARGRHDEAEAACRRLLALDADHLDARAMLAQLAMPGPRASSPACDHDCSLQPNTRAGRADRCSRTETHRCSPGTS
jgi:hypothetical protein